VWLAVFSSKDGNTKNMLPLLVRGGRGVGAVVFVIASKKKGGSFFLVRRGERGGGNGVSVEEF